MKIFDSLAGPILRSLEHLGRIRLQRANIALPSGLKESLEAPFRASAHCCGALGFYLHWEALRVNIILIPQNPSRRLREGWIPEVCSSFNLIHNLAG